MQSITHKQHIRHRISDSRCSECRADCERRFVSKSPFKYGHVREYLSWIRPRLEAIRKGESSVNARIWYREFLDALHTRISSHSPVSGRKMCRSYLERLRASNYKGNRQDAGYFREFARRGASALDF